MVDIFYFILGCIIFIPIIALIWYLLYLMLKAEIGISKELFRRD